MQEQQSGTRRSAVGRRAAAAAAIVLAVSAAGVAGAALGGVTTKGSGDGSAKVICPGGMSRLGHEFNEQMSVFPYDPAIHVSDVYTVADDFFKVEAISFGPHAGTHLDVPSHFIEDGRSIEELAAEEFVWPVYKIDVRGQTFTDPFLMRPCSAS